MIRYKGKKIVKVYAVKSPSPVGGEMVACGGYIGNVRHPEYLFYFDEEIKVAGGKKKIMTYRVLNVKKAGNYKKSDLLG